MDYYIIHKIFSFSDEINKRATASEFKYKSEISINNLLEASHHKKNLASLKYFNYLKAKEKTKPPRYSHSFYCIIKPKKVKPTKIKIQCYAETKKGTRCKFHITGMGCVLFCSRHQTCSKVCWS